MKPISRRMKQVNREKDGKPVDVSQLRQPISLGGSVLDQVLNSVHYGSPEMRALLQFECNFIFECKVCRALFRDLPNFISHKRVFCQRSAIEEQWINLAQVSAEEVVMVEPEAPGEMRSEAPKEASSASAAVQDLPPGPAVEPGDQTSEGSRSIEQPTKLFGAPGAPDQFDVSTEQCCASDGSPPTNNHTESHSNSTTDHQSSSQTEQQQHKSLSGVATRSAPRQSLEDTVQRLVQAKNLGQSYSLRVYTKAVEKLQRQKENTKVTTIRTTPIPTNSNAVFVDISTKSKYKNNEETSDDVSSDHKVEKVQRPSRKKGLLSSQEDKSEGMQRDSKIEEERKLRKREDEQRLRTREDRQKSSKKKEEESRDDLQHKTRQEDHRPLKKREEISWDEVKEEQTEGDRRKSQLEIRENVSAVRDKFTHIPKDLVRVGKPRTSYPEPQQILMDQLREMQDKVKQKAVAEGKPEVLDVSDDENDCPTDDSSTFSILSPTRSDDMAVKVSPTTKKSPNQRNGVYKCRMCMYEAEDKADCIRHILRKHRYAMRHKSTLAIRSMAVYQSSSKKQTKPSSNEMRISSKVDDLQEDKDNLHDIVRKNLQSALQKAEEVLKTQQSSSPKEENKTRCGQEKEEANHPLVCVKCNKVYSSKYTLSFHMSIVHAETRTYFPCTMCKSVFASLQGVMRHLRILHGKPSEKVDQMREKLKRKAFTKPVSQPQPQQQGERGLGIREPLRKRPLEDSPGFLAKRRRLDTKDKNDDERQTPRATEIEVKTEMMSSSVSSGVDRKETVTKTGPQTVGSTTQVTTTTKSENVMGSLTPLKTPRGKLTPKSNLEKNESTSQLARRSDVCLRRSQSPRGSLPQDLSQRSSSYVCKKCKLNFGRKISYDNHVEVCRGPRQDSMTTPKSGIKAGNSKLSNIPNQGSSQTPNKKDEQKEKSSKVQTLPKALSSVPVSISTRSRHRDSSSESQRSTSSDVQASARPRTRVSRSLTPDRNICNRKSLAKVKNSNREKLLRRQVASFGNLNDGVRGRAHRSVFSKYAKTIASGPKETGRISSKLESPKQEEKDKHTGMKHKINPKKAASPSPKSSLSSSKSSVDMNTPCAKNNKNILTRQAKSILKPETVSNPENDPSLSDEPDVSISMSTSNNRNQSTSIKDCSNLGQEAGCSDSEKYNENQSTRGDRLSQRRGGASSQAAEERALPHSSLQSEAPSQREASSWDELGVTASNLSVQAEPTEELENVSLSDHSEDKKSEPQLSATPTLGLSNTSEETSADDIKSLPWSSEDCVKKNMRRVPNIHAIDKLMDSLKQSSVKKTTNRGKRLDETGLRLSGMKGAPSSDVEDCDLSESRETLQPHKGDRTWYEQVEQKSNPTHHDDPISNERAGVTGLQSSTAVSTINSTVSKIQSSEQHTPNKDNDIKDDCIFSMLLSDSSEDINPPTSHHTGSTSSEKKTKEDSAPMSDNSVNIGCLEILGKGSAKETLGSPQEDSVNKVEDKLSIDLKVPTERESSPTSELASSSLVIKSKELPLTLSKPEANDEEASTDTDQDLQTPAEKAYVQLNGPPETSPAETLNSTKKSPEINYTQSRAIIRNSPAKFVCLVEVDNSSSALPLDIVPSGKSEVRSSRVKSLPKQSPSSSSVSETEVLLRSRARSKQCKEASLQNVEEDKVKDSKEPKRDLRSQIVSQRIKERHRASSGRSFRNSAGNNSGSSKTVESSSRHKSQDLCENKKQASEASDISSPGSNYVNKDGDGPFIGKRSRKKGKEATRIKSTANRSYVMRSSAGEDKLECFDKAKIFRFIDKTKTKCLACGMKYTKMYNLRRHIISNHLKWTRYRCSLCGTETYDRSHCVRHVKKAHRQLLKEKSIPSGKEVIINLTKQGSQARSKKISHSIKRNQETERKQSESIYARPTLSLRRRGRPTLALLSSSSYISDQTPSPVRERSALDSKKVSPSNGSLQQGTSSRQASELDSMQTQERTRETCSAQLGTVCADRTAAKKAPNTVDLTAITEKEGVQNTSSGNHSEHLYSSSTSMQNVKETNEKRNAFSECASSQSQPSSRPFNCALASSQDSQMDLGTIVRELSDNPEVRAAPSQCKALASPSHGSAGGPCDTNQGESVDSLVTLRPKQGHPVVDPVFNSKSLNSTLSKSSPSSKLKTLCDQSQHSSRERSSSVSFDESFGGLIHSNTSEPDGHTRRVSTNSESDDIQSNFDSPSSSPDIDGKLIKQPVVCIKGLTDKKPPKL